MGNNSVSLSNKNPFASQAKMLWHIERLSEWRLQGDTFPIHIEVNPSNYCNEGCRWCISSYSHISNPSMSKEERKRQIKQLDSKSVISGHPKRRRGIELDSLKIFMKDASLMGLKAITWSGGGEPTSYLFIQEAIKFSSNLGLNQGMMTNGLYPKSYIPTFGNNLDWMRVSLDTLDSKKYEHQKFSKRLPDVISNIESIVSYPISLGINMNLADWNANEVLQIAKWSREVGASYFQIRPILGLPFEIENNPSYRKQLDSNWLTKIKPLLIEAEAISDKNFSVLVSWDKFDDLQNVEGNYGRSYSKCMSHYFVCVLDADGGLKVCMYHLNDERFCFGNIYENSLSEIWKGDQRKQVLQMCANNLDLSTCQVCCKGHEINKFIDFIENPNEKNGVNFL